MDINEVVAFCRVQLEIHPSVKVKIIKSFEDENFKLPAKTCGKVWSIHHSTKDFLIVYNEKLSDQKIIETICHEMVHVSDFSTNRLIINSHYIMFDSKIYFEGINYYDMPHEKEAFALEKLLLFLYNKQQTDKKIAFQLQNIKVANQLNPTKTSTTMPRQLKSFKLNLGVTMKTLALISTMLLTFKINALEYTSQVKCINNNCVNVSKISGLPNVDLKLNQLEVDQCLLNILSSEVYRILELNKTSGKIVLVVETEPYVLKRDIFFYSDKSFNRNLKIAPCQEISNSVFSDENQFKACINSNGIHSFKFFCEKPQLTNF